jgi:CubicO group peptidase (beta-lactamase class C family)
MKRQSRKLLIIGIVFLLMVGACAAPALPTATPVPPTATVPPPTATVALPTATNPPPAATVPPPTATPLPPIVTVPPPTATAAPTPTLSPANATLAASLDAQFHKWAADGTLSGAVLVARNGRVMLSQGYGFADRVKKTPNTPQTKFRIASLTKAFTAMAILILQEQGKLTVQDKLCTYMADCPDSWKPVTLHHLLTHTSGIFDSVDMATPADQVVTYAKAFPMASQPGQKFSYNNTGYILLGKVIEAVSGQTYETFLQKNIFEPLQMSRTGYDHGQADLALGYSGATGTLPVQPTNPQAVFAAGALYSTVEDVYRWDQALYTEKLIPRRSLDAMFTAQAPLADGSGESYGYGWFIVPDKPRLINHQGSFAGFVSDIHRYPDDNATIIVLSNQDNTAPYNTAELVAGQLIVPAALNGRGHPAIAYDPEANRVILFGGIQHWPTPLLDTWAYDPAAKQWSRLHPAQAPQGAGSMVYDSRAGRMILYASSSSDLTNTKVFGVAPQGETWAYDSKTDTWTNRQAANTPQGLAFARLAYDSESDRVILFGGVDYSQGTQFHVPESDATWAYDFGANTWTKMNPDVKPPARDGQAMTYDVAADRVIVFGGETGGWENGLTDTPLGDAWAYDYNTDAWTELKPAAAPAPRCYASFVYDPGTQRDLLVGGDPLQATVPYFADTWAYIFKSNTWTNLSPSTGPSPMAYQGMAFIPTTKQIVAFVGGSLYAQYVEAYWLYDLAGNQWRMIPIKP